MRTAVAILCRRTFRKCRPRAARRSSTCSPKARTATRFTPHPALFAPHAIGTFVRDAAGETDPERQTASCSYSTLDGVYGIVTLVPLRDGYDPKNSLAPQFEEAGNAPAARWCGKAR